MDSGVIPTARRLQFAKGYIELGMVNEASDELEGIGWDKRSQQLATDDPDLTAMWDSLAEP